MEDARGPPRDNHFRTHQEQNSAPECPEHTDRQQCKWTCPMRLEDARETLIEVVATWVDIYGKSECKH